MFNSANTIYEVEGQSWTALVVEMLKTFGLSTQRTLTREVKGLFFLCGAWYSNFQGEDTLPEFGSFGSPVDLKV